VHGRDQSVLVEGQQMRVFQDDDERNDSSEICPDSMLHNQVGEIQY
jgi:hypothetical protein